MNISTRGARPWFTPRNYPDETAFIADTHHILFPLDFGTSRASLLGRSCLVAHLVLTNGSD
jgi:hypothetical protein